MPKCPNNSLSEHTGDQHHNILLLTSTIAPRNGLRQGVQNDASQRLREYQDALSFYLGILGSGTISRIVYADNSGYPLDALKQLAESRGLAGKVDFLSFEATVGPDHGRMYLELDLLRTAMSLPPLNDVDEITRIWKVTGRYTIRNLRKIIGTAPAADIWLNSRNYPTPWTDFFVAGFTRKGFSRLFSKEESDLHADTNTSGEVILRSRISSHDFCDLKIVPRFHTVPRVDGVRAYDGASYSDLKGNLKYFGRVIISRILPSLWL